MRCSVQGHDSSGNYHQTAGAANPLHRGDCHPIHRTEGGKTSIDGSMCNHASLIPGQYHRTRTTTTLSTPKLSTCQVDQRGAKESSSCSIIKSSSKRVTKKLRTRIVSLCVCYKRHSIEITLVKLMTLDIILLASFQQRSIHSCNAVSSKEQWGGGLIAFSVLI